jgi:hypothetical protein
VHTSSEADLGNMSSEDINLESVFARILNGRTNNPVQISLFDVVRIDQHQFPYSQTDELLDDGAASS